MEKQRSIPFRSPHKFRPDLVILDLNLPKQDGTEVLKVIRGELVGPRLPVIIYSSSPQDLIKTKLQQANLAADCYVTKPMGLEPFVRLARQFRNCYERALSGRNVTKKEPDLSRLTPNS